MVGLACIHGDAEGLARLPSAQRVAFRRDVDDGVVFGGHDGESTGLVADDITVAGIASIGRLVETLDDVFIAQAFGGQHEGSVEGNVGDVGAIHRDGVVGLHLDAFLTDCLVIVLVVIALSLRNFHCGDAVGPDRELLLPSCEWIGYCACAVALGADEHLRGNPTTATGVVPEPVVHEGEPKLLALGRGVLCGCGREEAAEDKNKSDNIVKAFHNGL